MADAERTKRIFLSSTAKDLRECREAACKAITSAGHRCVRMEDFPSTHESPEECCKRYIQDCELFVGLLGPCYGSSPQGRDLSFTELEFNTAQVLEKKCLMFLTADDFPVPANYVTADKRLDKQLDFRDRVRKKLMTGVFHTADELKFQVLAALLKLWEVPLEVDCVVLCGGSGARLWPADLGFLQGVAARGG